MSELRDALQRELNRLESQLEKELASNPTYLRMKKVKAFLADYPTDEEAPPASAQLSLDQPKAPRPSALFPGMRDLSALNDARPESRKAKIIAMVDELITSGSGSTTRQTIIGTARERQLVPDDPKKATKIIAPILTEAKQFRSAGGGIWVRAKTSSPQGETGAVGAPVSH